MVAEQDDNRSWTIDMITSYNARDFFLPNTSYCAHITFVWGMLRGEFLHMGANIVTGIQLKVFEPFGKAREEIVNLVG